MKGEKFDQEQQFVVSECVCVCVCGVHLFFNKFKLHFQYMCTSLEFE